MSNTYLEKKDYKLALECIEKALTLRPNYGKAYLNKGRLMKETRRYQESYEAFKKCCTQADFDNELGFIMFADSCMTLGKYDEAINACKQALTCNPKSALATFNLANCYFLNKQFELALRIYQELTKISNDPKLLLNLAETYATLGRHKEAYAVYQDIEKNNKNIPEVTLAKAGCLERLGLPQEAQRLLKEFLATKPEPYYKFLAELALKNLKSLHAIINPK